MAAVRWPNAILVLLFTFLALGCLCDQTDSSSPEGDPRTPYYAESFITVFNEKSLRAPTNPSHPDKKPPTNEERVDWKPEQYERYLDRLLATRPTIVNEPRDIEADIVNTFGIGDCEINQMPYVMQNSDQNITAQIPEMDNAFLMLFLGAETMFVSLVPYSTEGPAILQSTLDAFQTVVQENSDESFERGLIAMVASREAYENDDDVVGMMADAEDGISRMVPSFTGKKAVDVKIVLLPKIKENRHRCALESDFHTYKSAIDVLVPKKGGKQGEKQREQRIESTMKRYITLYCDGVERDVLQMTLRLVQKEQFRMPQFVVQGFGVDHTVDYEHEVNILD